MDKRPADRELTERGVSSAQFVLASALALLLFVAFANLVVVQYGKGTLRSAAEQGARAGALSSSTSDCVAKAEEVIAQLLGGAMSETVAVRCQISGTMVSADAEAVFTSWTPLTPDYPVNVSATALRELGP